MPNFLIDENLSPKLASFLRNLGYQASAVRDVSLKGKPDEEVIKFAQKKNLVIITCDLGFGESFYFNTSGAVSFIILRSHKQSLPYFQQILELLHNEGILKEKLSKTLVVASHTIIRRRTFPPSTK